MDDDVIDESTILLFQSQKSLDQNTAQSGENFVCCGLMKWHWMDSYEYRSVDQKNSVFSTVVLLLNAMIGSGLLVQPYAFRSAGVLGISLEYLIFSILTYWGVETLLTAAENHGVYDFGHLVVLSAGNYYGQLIYDLVILLGGLGSMLSYVFIIQSLSINIVSNFYSFSSTHELNALKVVATVVSFIVITPLCLIRNFGHLSRVSFVSIVAVCATVLVVLVQGIYSVIVRWSYSTADNSSTTTTTEQLEIISISGVLSSLGSVVFAFSFSAALFPALRAGEAPLLESPNVARASLRATVLLGVLICFVIGLSGYLSYGSDTESDILLSFEGVQGIVLQAVFVVHLCLVLPADLLVLRPSPLRLIGVSDDLPSRSVHVLSTLMLLGSLAAVSSLLLRSTHSGSALALVLEISGGFCQSMISFTLPAWVGLALLPQEEILLGARAKAWLLLAAGLLLPVIVTVYALSGTVG